MKPKVVIEDRASWRGFFSTLNLLMFAIVWCEDNGFQPIFGKTLFTDYSHSLVTLLGRNPFNSFWVSDYGTITVNRDIVSVIDINDIFMSRDWYHNNIEFLPRLQQLSRSFVGKLLVEKAKRYMESRPSLYHQNTNYSELQYSNNFLKSAPPASVHYRGGDYLANTPGAFHQKNISPDYYAELLTEHIPEGSNVFVATDDSSFLNILSKKSFAVYSFNDVQRGKPGRGVHRRSKLQKLGFERFSMPWLRGMQVLRDCDHLSKGKVYYGTNSNLMFFASLLNPEMKTINFMEK